MTREPTPLLSLILAMGLVAVALLHPLEQDRKNLLLIMATIYLAASLIIHEMRKLK